MDTSASAVLPTHTTAAPPPSSKAIPADDVGLHDERRRRRRRRRCVVACLVAAAAVTVLAVTLLVLFLTVLRVRDPTTRLVSSRVIGLAPSLTPSLHFNFTLLLTVAVHNPNPASFSFASGQAWVRYRDILIADAEVEPGRVPSRGDGTVQLEMTVLSESFAAPGVMAQLIKDLEAGSVPITASARIPGKVGVFGVFHLRAVAYSDCDIVFGVPEMQVRSQECRDHAKL